MTDNLKTYFEGEEIQKHARTICELTRECWERGLSDSTGFSISQVIPDTDYILVDKSGTGFRRNRITPYDLLLINREGELVYQPNNENPRKAPVNVAVHLEGYKASDARGCIHWHDPFTNAFACYGKTIHPLTLQSKLIGDVSCIIIDDREQKNTAREQNIVLPVPSGLHARPDVYFVMEQVGQKVASVLKQRNTELQKHGIVITHYEHGLFSFGRTVEEAFENGYRAVRNAQTIVYSRLLDQYPDEKSQRNAGHGDAGIIPG
jgi:ribulose-5-phosphate 4-epimerase/fuculose-1-phosphate aldolase